MHLIAYYTKIDSGEAFERSSRTGPHADIVVSMRNNDEEWGKFIFHRKTSYRPYWQTGDHEYPVPELVSRCGDGDDKRPDRVNAHSHVRIIETDDQCVSILWRYVPKFSGTNPHRELTPYGFVEESFTIHANGEVLRTLRRGTPHIDDWNAGATIIEQILRLSAHGIDVIRTTRPQASPITSPPDPSPIRTISGPSPALEFTFDEGNGNFTQENISNHQVRIQGVKPYWTPGISGFALHFDGYTSSVLFTSNELPTMLHDFTIETWVFLCAYPWNWVPIFQWGEDNGIFFGINGHGRPGIRLWLHNDLIECIAPQTLERYQWYHLATRYHSASGALELFVNGKNVAMRNTEGGTLLIPRRIIKIGKGEPRIPCDPVRPSSYPSEYAFDGILDEIRCYHATLEDSVICEHAIPPEHPPTLPRRQLPAFSLDTFTAHQTKIRFYETWDNLIPAGNHPDIVIGFDEVPTHFVFWRAMNYVPMIVNEKGQWYSNEFNETWNTSGGHGCQEPMSDKQNHYSHVRLIEDTPVRKVVHWRFALIDTRKYLANFDPETGWGDFADWYYYIYPDGFAVKTMRLWTHGLINHEWQESMAIFGPDQHPEQIIDTERTITLLDLDGNKAEYSWKDGPPSHIHEPIDKCIQYIHYRAQYHPVTIVPELARYDVYSGELTDYSVFPTWNHWPVAQIISDGRYASFPDRTAHSSLTHFIPAPFRSQEVDAPWQERVMMEGMTNLPPEDTVALARSWIQPPPLLWASTCSYLGYERGRRAYVLRKFPDKPVQFHIHASQRRPFHNICFEIRGWPNASRAILEIDGE
ncbi:MAG: LamG domain-containing protein, partial [Lentisphaerae bacterium]